jgi:DNA polymerase III alpha subunit
VDVLGPDVNESQYKFSVNEKGQVRFGLGAIKGIGRDRVKPLQEKEKTEDLKIFMISLKE